MDLFGYAGCANWKEAEAKSVLFPTLSSENSIDSFPLCSLKHGKKLLEQGKFEESIPYLHKAQEDPDNLDMCVSMAEKMMPASIAMGYYHSAEALGECSNRN